MKKWPCILIGHKFGPPVGPVGRFEWRFSSPEFYYRIYCQRCGRIRDLDYPLMELKERKNVAPQYLPKEGIGNPFKSRPGDITQSEGNPVKPTTPPPP